jgi:TctA family transporter
VATRPPPQKKFGPKKWYTNFSIFLTQKKKKKKKNRIPRPYLFAGIVTFALMGSYAVKTSIFDVQVAVAIGIYFSQSK